MLHHFGKSNLYETTKQSKIMSEHFLQKKILEPTTEFVHKKNIYQQSFIRPNKIKNSNR